MLRLQPLCYLRIFAYVSISLIRNILSLRYSPYFHSSVFAVMLRECLLKHVVHRSSLFNFFLGDCSGTCSRIGMNQSCVKGVHDLTNVLVV